MKDKIIFIGYILIGFLIIYLLFFVWLPRHDKAIEDASDKYENCVKEEYGVTPSYYYAENGEYPECLK